MLEVMTIDAQHDAAVHRDEPAVAVVGEALIVRAARQTLHARIVEAEVENGVHHSGHREFGTRTHRHQQWIFGVAEFATHLLFQRGDVCGDFFVEPLRPTAAHVVAAGVGGDGEAVRHGQLEHRHHLGEVRALAAEQVFHAHRGLAVLVVKRVDIRHTFGQAYERASCSAVPRCARSTMTSA